MDFRLSNRNCRSKIAFWRLCFCWLENRCCFFFLPSAFCVTPKNAVISMFYLFLKSLRESILEFKFAILRIMILWIRDNEFFFLPLCTLRGLQTPYNTVLFKAYNSNTGEFKFSILQNLLFLSVYSSILLHMRPSKPHPKNLDTIFRCKKENRSNCL